METPRKKQKQKTKARSTNAQPIGSGASDGRTHLASDHDVEQDGRDETDEEDLAPPHPQWRHVVDDDLRVETNQPIAIAPHFSLIPSASQQTRIDRREGRSSHRPTDNSRYWFFSIHLHLTIEYGTKEIGHIGLRDGNTTFDSS